MKKLDNRGSVLTVILLLLVAAAIVFFIFFKDKFGFGSGSDGDGKGDKNVESSVSTEVTIENTTEQDGSAEKIITIVVKQSKYYIDDKEYTLAEIEGLIKDDTEKTAKYVMEDNYAGAEAWDQLKSLFTSYDITPVKND